MITKSSRRRGRRSGLQKTLRTQLEGGIAVKLKKWCVIFSLVLVAGFAVSLSGGRTSSTTGEALAADLSNGNDQTCNGTGLWHFVNNQIGGATTGILTATFSCVVDPITVAPSHVTPGTIHFEILSGGNCTLQDASTDLPVKLVLSDFTCAQTPTPTPTPTPSPTPKPTPTKTPTPTPTPKG